MEQQLEEKEDVVGKGYPEQVESGKTVKLEELPANAVCFHAGTKINSGQVITAGGRVFGVTAWAESLAKSVKSAYDGVDKINFDGMQYRTDIAGKG